MAETVDIQRLRARKDSYWHTRPGTDIKSVVDALLDELEQARAELAQAREMLAEARRTTLAVTRDCDERVRASERLIARIRHLDAEVVKVAEYGR